jgi:hypothetical protein
MQSNIREFKECLLEKINIENSLKRLEPLKAEDKITEEQYTPLKKEYTEKIATLEEKLRKLREQLNQERTRVEVEKRGLEEQLERLETRLTVGELSSDAYSKEKRRIQREIEGKDKNISLLQRVASAESAEDLEIEEQRVASVDELPQPEKMSLKEVITSPRLFGPHPKLLIPLAISVGLGLLMGIWNPLAAVISVFATLVGPTMLFMREEFLPIILGVIGLMTIPLIVAFVVWVGETFLASWVSAMLREVHAEGMTDIKSSLSIVWRNFGSVIIAAIILAIIFSVLILIDLSLLSGLIVISHSTRIAISASAVLGVLIIIFAISLIYTQIAIVKHDFGAGSGMSASWRFVWRGKNFWRTVALGLIMGILQFIPGVGIILAAFIFPLWMPYAYVEYS